MAHPLRSKQQASQRLTRRSQDGSAKLHIVHRLQGRERLGTLRATCTRVRRMRTAISLLLDCCCGCCCVNDWRAGPSSQRYCKLFGATILMASVNASELPLVNAFRSA